MSEFLFAWGSNQHNQCLIDSNTKTISMELGFENRVLIDQNIKYIKCGSSHSVILTRSGHVYGWGNNNYNQLGEGCNKLIKPTKINITHTCMKSKSKFEYFDSVLIKKISCGGSFTIFITQCNCIIKYGSIIGDINNNINLDLPCFLGSISKVSCGQCHVVLLLSSGQVACFGRNMYGQIGIPRKDLDNNLETVSNPQIVTSHFSHRVIKIAAGTYHTLCLDEINQIFCWGYGLPCGVINGHLMQPSHMPGIYEPIKDLAGGSNHSMFLTNSNKIFAIGSNDFGQAVPNSPYPFLNSPVEIKSFDQNNLTNIYCSDHYSAAKTEKDEIYIWGKISYGITVNYQKSDIIKEPFKISINDVLNDNYVLNSLSFGSWHIVCTLSTQKIYNFSDDNSTSANSSDSESVDLSSESIKIPSTKAISNIINRERTRTTLKELYSKTPEMKSIEPRIPPRNITATQIQRSDNSKYDHEENSILLITNIGPKVYSEDPNKNHISVHFENNSTPIDIKSKLSENSLLSSENKNSENKTNYLRKSKTEFMIQPKMKKSLNLKSLSNIKENFKLPILVPGLINLQLSKEYTYGGNGTHKFGNGFKGILERSKTLCGKNKF